MSLSSPHTRRTTKRGHEVVDEQACLCESPIAVDGRGGADRAGIGAAVPAAEIRQDADGSRPRQRKAGARSQPADRRGLHQGDPQVHDRDLLHVAAGRLPAGVEDGPDAQGRAGRRRRSGRQAAVLQRGLRLHAPARQVDAAGARLHDRHDRRRARDDRGCGRVGSADGEARSEQGRSREARRSAHHHDGRWGGGRNRQARRTGLLPHRHHPFHRSRLADGADGAGLPPGGGRQPLHPQHPRPRHHAHHAGRRSRRPRPHRGRVRVAEEASQRDPDEQRLLGSLRATRQQPRRDGADAATVSARARHLPRVEGAGPARPARIGGAPLRQHDRQRSLQRVAGPDPDKRVAPDRLEQRQRNDAHGHARRLRLGLVRHLVARVPDVHGRDAQRHQPAVRDVRQRRQRRHGRADALPGRYLAHVVPAEPRTGPRPLVASQQQQLPADRHPGLAQPLREQPDLFPAQLLRQEQALDSEAEGRRPGRVRLPGHRSAPGHPGGVAARAAEAGRRNLARDGALHRDDPGAAGARGRPWRRPRWRRDRRGRGGWRPCDLFDRLRGGRRGAGARAAAAAAAPADDAGVPGG